MTSNTAISVYFGLGDFTEAGPSAPYIPPATTFHVGLESVDCHRQIWTVVLKLKERTLDALKRTAQPLLALAYWPPEVIEKYGDVTDWSNLVGTGPFETD